MTDELSNGTNGGPSKRLPIGSEDVANVLAFLSWHVPLEGSEPTKEVRDQIECGRMTILDVCRYALEAGQN